MYEIQVNDHCAIFLFYIAVDLATEALEFANGYLMYGKPLVISYGRKQ